LISTLQTLASFLFVLGVLIWNFSTKFQHAEKTITFSEFMQAADSGQVARVTITGNEITYITKASDNFRTYAPPQYEGLANKLIENSVVVSAREPKALESQNACEHESEFIESRSCCA